jgi:hypothetical protein
MLSFTKGKPIALITGGKYNNQIVHLYDPTKKCCNLCTPQCGQRDKNGRFLGKCCRECKGGNCGNEQPLPEIKNDPNDILDEDFIRSHKKKMSVLELNKLRKGLALNIPPLENDLNEIYHKCKEQFDNKSKKELKIHDNGVVQVLPNFNEPERSYICGPSGSGKSTYVSSYLQQLKKVYPKRDIFLISDVDKDDVLDKLNPMRIELDDAFLNTELHPKTFNDSIVVFDDIDSIENDKVKKKVEKLRDSLLKRGRHEETSVVVTNHLLTDYKHTRIILSEVNSITFFPKSGSSNAIHYTLSKYVGLTKEQIKKIFTLPSRWVTVYKHYPMYVLYEKGIYLL